MIEPRGFALKESSSSLHLQMLLYYNMVAALFFFCVESFAIAHKIHRYEIDTFTKVLTPLTFGVWTLAEVFRLWFGSTGNLQEKVPQLSAFFLVSVFPQIPCLVYLMTSQGVQLPFDTVCSAFLLVFVIGELVLSYGALTVLVRKQTANFLRLLSEEDEE